MGQTSIACLLVWGSEDTSPASRAQPESSHEEIAGKLSVLEITQSDCPRLLQMVRVMKDKSNRERKCYRWKEIKGTWQVNAMHDSRLGPRPEENIPSFFCCKRHYQDSEHKLNKTHRWNSDVISMLLPGFDNLPRLHEVLCVKGHHDFSLLWKVYVFYKRSSIAVYRKGVAEGEWYRSVVECLHEECIENFG